MDFLVLHRILGRKLILWNRHAIAPKTLPDDGPHILCEKFMPFAIWFREFLEVLIFAISVVGGIAVQN